MKALDDITKSTKDEAGCMFKFSKTCLWKSRVLCESMVSPERHVILVAGECSITVSI